MPDLNEESILNAMREIHNTKGLTIKPNFAIVTYGKGEEFDSEQIMIDRLKGVMSK